MVNSKMIFKLARALAAAVATAIACVIILYVSIPMSDTKQSQFDVILVLGNPAKADGSIAPVGESRVLEGIRQYRAGAAPRLLMTGGAVANRFVEAQVMRQFAISQGIPPSRRTGRRRIAKHHPKRLLLLQDHPGARLAFCTDCQLSQPFASRQCHLQSLSLEWRLDAAPWPPGYPLLKRIWYWTSETGYTSYGRIFGFPNARQFLPRHRLELPHL